MSIVSPIYFWDTDKTSIYLHTYCQFSIVNPLPGLYTGLYVYWTIYWIIYWPICWTIYCIICCTIYWLYTGLYTRLYTGLYAALNAGHIVFQDLCWKTEFQVLCSKIYCQYMSIFNLFSIYLSVTTTMKLLVWLVDNETTCLTSIKRNYLSNQHTLKLLV